MEKLNWTQHLELITESCQHENTVILQVLLLSCKETKMNLLQILLLIYD